MRILIVSVLLLSLASCTAPWSKPTSTNTLRTDGSGAVTQVSTGMVTPHAFAVTGMVTPREFAATGSVVTINYTLHIDSPSGPIQESTLQAVAQANGLYKTGATYQPFQVALGQNQVIYGFEQGLMGVKKWEKKTIKVIPSEGYGRPVTISKDQIAPEFSITRDKKMFENTLKQTIKKSEFPVEMQAKVSEAKIGDTLTGAQNALAKVVEVTADSITLTIENSANPFYKKELKVGSIATTDDADFKITAMDDKTITLSISNKKSPFYGKAFAIGESITPQNGSKITIKAIGDTTVSILAEHRFMNKDLYFDVEVADIQ